jgi:hypothetical protein
VHRLFMILALGLTLALGGVGHVSAAAPNANCTGAYASTYAGPQFGPFVSSSAHFFHAVGSSLGQGAVGPASSTNACAVYYPYPPY